MTNVLKFEIKKTADVGSNWGKISSSYITNLDTNAIRTNFGNYNTAFRMITCFVPFDAIYHNSLLAFLMATASFKLVVDETG